MIRVCAWCQKYLGEKEPLEDKSITHTICGACKEYWGLAKKNPRKEKE